MEQLEAKAYYCPQCHALVLLKMNKELVGTCPGCGGNKMKREERFNFYARFIAKRKPAPDPRKKKSDIAIDLTLK